MNTAELVAHAKIMMSEHGADFTGRCPRCNTPHQCDVHYLSEAVLTLAKALGEEKPHE